MDAIARRTASIRSWKLQQCPPQLLCKRSNVSVRGENIYITDEAFGASAVIVGLAGLCAVPRRQRIPIAIEQRLHESASTRYAQDMPLDVYKIICTSMLLIRYTICTPRF